MSDPVALVDPYEVECAFLTKLSVGGSDAMAVCTKAGVAPHWFTDPHCRKAWEIQVEQASAHGSPGTWELYAVHALGIKQVFKPADSMQTLVEALKMSTAVTLTKKAVIRFQRDADVGEVPVREAWNRLVEGVTSSDITSLLEAQGIGGTIADNWSRFIDLLEERKQALGVTGIPFPWSSLNTATGGMVPGSYSVFAGFRKAGKSDMAVEVTVETSRNHGHNTLVVCNEMTFDDMFERIACRWCEIPYELYFKGILPDDMIEQVLDTQSDLKHHADIAIENVAETGLAAISKVRSLIDRYGPELLIWDGHYLSAKSTDWNDVYQLSQRTRAMLRDEPLAGLVTVQLNPEKKQASYKAYHQDCTLFVKAAREADWLHCSTPEVRNGKPVKWSMRVERGLKMVETPWSGDVKQGTTTAPEVVLGQKKNED